MSRRPRCRRSGSDILTIDSATVTDAHQRAVMVIRLAGELDYATALDLELALSEVFTGDQARLVIDLAALDFCDAAGLGVFVAAHQACRTRQGWLRLAGVPDRLSCLLDITGLAGYLPCYTDTQQALADG